MDLKAIGRLRRAESGLLPGNRGFLLRPSGRPKASVLLLHGFSASPWEVREYGRHLQKRDYLVYAPRIAGHGAGRAEFDAATGAEWMASAEAAYAALRQNGKKMILIGHSAGGVLAARLAARYQAELRCLVLAAPAFRLADPMAPWSLIPLARWLRPSLHFEAVSADSKYWTLDYSSSRVAELVRAGRLGRKAALGLRLPLLLLQARGAGMVSRPFNEAFFKKIPSPHKKLVIYESDEHNVLHSSNPLQKQIFKRIDAFLKVSLAS